MKLKMLRWDATGRGSEVSFELMRAMPASQQAVTQIEEGNEEGEEDATGSPEAQNLPPGTPRVSPSLGKGMRTAYMHLAAYQTPPPATPRSRGASQTPSTPRGSFKPLSTPRSIARHLLTPRGAPTHQEYFKQQAAPVFSEPQTPPLSSAMYDVGLPPRPPMSAPEPPRMTIGMQQSQLPPLPSSAPRRAVPRFDPVFIPGLQEAGSDF